MLNVSNTVVAASLLFLFQSAAVPPAHSGERHVVLTNNTRERLIEIYVADDGTDNWQGDLLGSEFLLPDSSVSVARHPSSNLRTLRCPRSGGVDEWRSSRRREPLSACRALFSDYERCQRRSSAPCHAPRRARRCRNRNGGGGRFRDGWSGARLTKRSAALFRLTYSSAPVILLKI
jgi:hypothetical protein